AAAEDGAVVRRRKSLDRDGRAADDTRKVGEASGGDHLPSAAQQRRIVCLAASEDGLEPTAADRIGRRDAAAEHILFAPGPDGGETATAEQLIEALRGDQQIAALATRRHEGDAGNRRRVGEAAG